MGLVWGSASTLDGNREVWMIDQGAFHPYYPILALGISPSALETQFISQCKRNSN